MTDWMVSGSLVLAVLLLMVAGAGAAGEPAWIAPGGAPVAISADGRSVLSDGDIFSLYDAGGGKVWRGYGGSSVLSGSGVYSPLALTRDGAFSIVGTDSGILYLDRSQRVFWQDTRYHPVQVIALSPDENFVAAVADGQVSVYTRGGDLVWRNHTYPDVRSVGISREGLFTVAGAPGTIHAYNASGFELWNYSSPGVGKVIVSPPDSDIFAASDYTVLALHPSGTLLWTFYTGSEIRDLAVSGDGSSVAVGNQGGQVILLDRNGKQLFAASLGNWANAVSLSGDGSLVAAGGIDRKVYLFDRAGNRIFSYTTGSIVNGVAVSSDGTALAAGADMVYYFDLQQSPPPGETPTVTTPPVTVTNPVPPPATTTTPPPRNPAETPSPVVPSGTTPRESESGWAAIGALTMVFLGFALKRAG
ncbi:MAG TPA: PQQ-binding-like beta-propeller repeat protein [Methanomicrobiales archaeon]|nr:PQQ-binding-like beta-propeller repeat protein [Methanomicrobiales archaeon]